MSNNNCKEEKRNHYRVENEKAIKPCTATSCSNSAADTQRKDFEFQIANFSFGGLGVTKHPNGCCCPRDDSTPIVDFQLSPETGPLKSPAHCIGACVWRDHESVPPLRAGISFVNKENARLIWEFMLLRQFKTINPMQQAALFSALEKKYEFFPDKSERKIIIHFARRYVFPGNSAGTGTRNIKQIMSSVFALLAVRFYDDQRISGNDDIKAIIHLTNRVCKVITKISAEKRYSFLPVAMNKAQARKLQGASNEVVLRELQDFYGKTLNMVLI